MKILLVGDKESSYIWDHFDHDRFKDVDFVISTGDLKAAYLSFIVTMLNVPLYYVPGNHDKNYLNKPPEGCINIDGSIIEHDGLRIMGLGGSNVYRGGIHQYSESQMRRRFKRLRPKMFFKGGIDILISHSPAFELNDGKDKCHTGFKIFRTIIEKYNPKYFFHGHQHLNYSLNKRIIKYSDTIIINTYEYYLLDTDKNDIL